MSAVPYSKKVKRHKRFVTKDAYWKEEDTGELQVVTIIKEDGRRIEEERPVKQRVFIEAQFEVREIEEEVWLVPDGEEEHEFTGAGAEIAAKDFAKSVKG